MTWTELVQRFHAEVPAMLSRLPSSGESYVVNDPRQGDVCYEYVKTVGNTQFVFWVELTSKTKGLSYTVPLVTITAKAEKWVDEGEGFELDSKIPISYKTHAFIPYADYLTETGEVKSPDVSALGEALDIVLAMEQEIAGVANGSL